MGILSFLERSSFNPGIFAGNNIEDPTSTLAAPAAWLLDALGARPSAAGVNVSPKTALSYSPAAACIRVLAETVASVKIALVQKVGDRQILRHTNHPVHDIVTRKFNPDLLAFNGLMNMQGHVGGWGNAFAEIEYSRDGFPCALHPLLPDRTFAERTAGKKWIRTTIGTEPVTLPAARVLHAHGWGFDGLMGYSPIRLATQGIGLGMAAEEFGSRWFSGGSNPSGFLTSDKPIKKERADLIKERWEALHQGLTQAHRVAVLEDGLKFNPITVNPQDAQLLETRKFQVEEQCRCYRMAPHMIQHVEAGGAKANMEQQGLEFVMFTMMTWFRMWEDTLTDALLSTDEIRQGYQVWFLVGSLLRGDFKTQAEAIALLRQWGVYSANDARARIDENAIENGDTYLVPMNMISAEVAATWKPSAPDPAEPKPAKPNPSPNAPAPNRPGSFQLFARYQERMASVVAHAAARYVRVEVKHARRALQAKPSPEAFAESMEQLWAETLPGMIRADLAPGLTTLADLTAEAAASDVGIAEAPEQARSLATLQLDAAVQRHVLVSRAALASKDPQELAGVLAKWEESRAQEIGTSETWILSNMLVAEIFRLGGIQ